MPYYKFDLRKLERLNDESRLEQLSPETMWDALGRPHPSTVVDIGAGTGLFAARFASLAPRALVYCVDMQPEMLAWIRENRPEYSSGRLITVLAEQDAIPLPDAMADLVVMINLHHELARPEATYAEAFRIAKNGGQLLVVDWAPMETPHGPPLSVRATSDELARYVRTAGFTSVRKHPGLPWHSLITATRPARPRHRATHRSEKAEAEQSGITPRPYAP